jgi:hypothetical protein
MKMQIKIALLAFACLARFYATGQTSNSKKLETYWVNSNYLGCIDSGKSVCDCQKRNNFLLIYMDKIENKLIIHPSIYYSWETIEIDIKPDPLKKNLFTLLPSHKIDSGSFVNVTGKELILKSPNKTVIFSKIEVPQLDTSGLKFDMGQQIGLINSKPLLNYSIKLSKGNTLFLTKSDIEKYVSNGSISIDCSDDFYYNEMGIDVNKNYMYYFLQYNHDTIKIYQETIGRDRWDSIYVDSLKSCELLYKMK